MDPILEKFRKRIVHLDHVVRELHTALHHQKIALVDDRELSKLNALVCNVTVKLNNYQQSISKQLIEAEESLFDHNDLVGPMAESTPEPADAPKNGRRKRRAS